MNNSNFNQNDEMEPIEPTTEETPVVEEAAEVGEVVDVVEVAEEVDAVEAAEDVEETQNAPKRAVHQTAAAAALNAEGEEVDIRRRTPRKEKQIKKSRISYERKKGLYGYGFIALWALGTIYMFIIPLFQSLWFSLCKTELVGDAATALSYGMSGPGVYTEWNNFANYNEALVTNAKFLKALTESLSGMAPQALMVLIFSLFIAVLLSQKFKGRTLSRAIFFLPVLIATGPVIAVIKGDILSNGVADASQFSSLFQTNLVDDLLSFLGIYNINQQFTETITSLTSDIFNLVWNAGIQILIFLAALQQIPTSAKEAASMEGATGWEFFWKITFPTISPMILANLIYTIIDTFVDSENPVMKMVIEQSRGLNYGLSATFAWVYFAIVAVVLAIVVAIVSKFVFYEVD